MFEIKFNRFCDKVVAVIKGFTGILLLAMLLVIILQVIGRGIFNIPTPWTEEISTYLVIYITFVGGVAVMIRGEHLAIDLVTGHVSPKLRIWFQVIYCITFLFVCTWLTVYGAQLCLSPLIQKQMSIATNIPRVYIYVIMPISMALCDVYCLFHLGFLFKHMVMKETEHMQPEISQEAGSGEISLN